MSEAQAMDPEVRALLSEIVSDPGSRLLRVKPADVRKTLFETHPRVSPTAAFLSKAERRLLEVHREEVRLLLYWFACASRHADPVLSRKMHKSITVDRELVIPDQEVLRKRGRTALDRMEGSDIDEEAGELLRRCVEGNGSGEVSRTRLMVAASRVAPSDSIRIFLGQELHLSERQSRNAEALLRDLLAKGTSALLASYAWEHIGHMACESEQYQLAAQAYRLASVGGEQRSMPLIYWLFASIQSGDATGAENVASRLDDMVNAEHPSVRWYTESQAVARQRQEWTPTNDARHVLSRIEDQLGTVSKKTLDVF